MDATASSYHSSIIDKSEIEAKDYTKTHQSSHRYLAYRDLPFLFRKYLGNSLTDKVALDYGAGTGYSTEYLKQQGLRAIGVDVSHEMLEQARFTYPDLPFYEIINGVIPLEQKNCDIIFSSFVLFEMSSREEILSYLSEVKRVLKEGGIFVALTGSEHLHSASRKWLNFYTEFEQNKDLESGKEVKLLLKELNIEFTDYFWTENDYKHFFSEAGLTIEEFYHPLGKVEEPYSWSDETMYSPYLIMVAKIRSKTT